VGLFREFSVSLCTPPRNAICLASDQNYIDYTYVTVLSIAEHASPAQHYEIVILSSGVLEYKKKIFYRLNSENFTVRFIDMEEYIAQSGMENFFTSGHISLATYFRYFIPDIFKNYDRVLYLDGDIIAHDDIANIFLFNIKGYLLGVVQDADRYFFDEERKKYISNHLGVDYTKYFCAGLILYNIPECLSFNLTKKCFITQERLVNPLFHDQDVLNSITFQKNYFIPLRWHLMSWIYSYNKLDRLKELFPDYFIEYLSASNDVALVHFGGGKKPWNDPKITFADLWWEVAHKTPFYERFLSEVTQYQISTVVDRDARRVTVLSSKRNSIKLRHTAYRLLSKITSGSLRKKLMNKRQKLKAQLDLLKNWEK